MVKILSCLLEKTKEFGLAIEINNNRKVTGFVSVSPSPKMMVPEWTIRPSVFLLPPQWMM